MNAILISGSYKGIKIDNKIIEFIKKYLKNNITISFIASDFENVEINKKFVLKLVEEFQEKKLIFNKVNLIDIQKSQDEMISDIKTSDIIFLLGGDTLKQIYYINKFDLKKYINDNKKIVIGISAGAINLSNKVVLAKDENDNIPELSIYDGIGISSINIEPHCEFKNKEHMTELKLASMHSPIILMNDDCFIIIENDTYKYFGSYLILDKKKFFYNDKRCTLEYFLKEIKYD